MSAFRDILCLLRACLKSSSLCQNSLIFEHRSAVYIKVNEQRSAKNRWVMAKIGDFEQALRRYAIVIFLCLGLFSHGVEAAIVYPPPHNQAPNLFPAKWSAHPAYLGVLLGYGTTDWSQLVAHCEERTSPADFCLLTVSAP